MRLRLRKYLWPLVASFTLTLIVAGIASIPGLENVGVLLLPGVFASALIFPGGPHSDWPMTFLVVAALANALILTWPACWLSTRIIPSRKNELR